MTHSADDLKWLKDRCSKAEQFCEPETEIQWRDLKALLARLEAAEKLGGYANHDTECIRTYWEAGEPTSGGGYHTKFEGKWYQSRPIDQEPKCTCGLQDTYDAWRKKAEKL